MKVKKAVIWWLVNNKPHPCVRIEDVQISSLMPIVRELFPGIDYYSSTGFAQVMTRCVIPVLKKRFPELQSAPGRRIRSKDQVEITQFLPSRGYEWQDSGRWQNKFDRLLAAVKP